MAESKTEKLLTIREAAEVLGVSQALMYALCSSRKIRHERHGLRRGRIRIPQDALDEYRQGQTVGVKNPPPPHRMPAPPQLKHLTLS